MIQVISMWAVYVVLVIVIGWLFVKDYIRDLRPGILKVYMFHAEGNKTVHRCKITDGLIHINDDVYLVDPDCNYQMGFFRIPCADYIEGCMEPINLKQRKLESKLSAKDYHERMETHVASDAIRTFEAGWISPQMMLMLILAVVAVGVLLLWWTGHQDTSKVTGELQAIHEILAPSTPTPTPGSGVVP